MLQRVKKISKLAVVFGLFSVMISGNAFTLKYCAYQAYTAQGEIIPGISGTASAPTMVTACFKARRLCNKELNTAINNGTAPATASCKKYVVP